MPTPGDMEVVILCGGKGTRSYPFTEYFPKVMMPINGTPILVHLMRIYAAQGFTNFVLAAGHRKEILIDYFDGRCPDWNVRIVDTGSGSDTGERLRRCARTSASLFLPPTVTASGTSTCTAWRRFIGTRVAWPP